MTIDIGSETAGAAIAPIAEKKGTATKRECTKTGKLHIIGFETEALSKATKVVVGIRKEAAGAVGEFMAESAETTIEELKAKKWEIPLTSDVEIVSGTSYFLCVISAVGVGKVKATEKAGWGFKTTAAITKISEGTWTTAENKWGEPAPIWGVEAEGGVLLPQCKAAVTVASKVGPVQTLAASLATKVIVQGKTVAFQTTLARCVSSISFRSAAVANQILSLSGSSKVVIGQHLTAAQAMVIAGSSKVTFAQKATVKVTGGEAARIVAIFIFEDDED